MKNKLLHTKGVLYLIALLLINSSATLFAQVEPCSPEAISAQIAEKEAEMDSAEAVYDGIPDQIDVLLAENEQLNEENRKLLVKIKVNENSNAKLKAIIAGMKSERSYKEVLYLKLKCPDPQQPQCEVLSDQIAELTSSIEQALKDIETLEVENTELTTALAENEIQLQKNEMERARLVAMRKALSTYIRKIGLQLRVLRSELKVCCQNNWDQDGDGYGSTYCGGEDCDDKDATVYPGAPEICNDGKDNDCDGLVDESEINVDAGTCVSAYFGYAPMDGATLNASVSGGSGTYSYAWSNGGNTSSITVTPSETTEYSVTVTDSYGCTAVASVTVQVIDVRCGNKGDKVMVCHSSGKSGKTEQLCIASSAVKAHLKHGDQLGACDQDDPCGNSAAMYLDPDLAEMVSELEESFHIYPNPAQTEISVIGHSASPYSVDVLNTQGKSIMNFEHQTEDQKVDISGLPNGIYFFRIQSGNYQQIERVVIMH